MVTQGIITVMTTLVLALGHSAGKYERNNSPLAPKTKD
jgi:hypothetical protein